MYIVDNIKYSCDQMWTSQIGKNMFALNSILTLYCECKLEIINKTEHYMDIVLVWFP